MSGSYGGCIYDPLATRVLDVKQNEYRPVQTVVTRCTACGCKKPLQELVLTNDGFMCKDASQCPPEEAFGC